MSRGPGGRSRIPAVEGWFAGEGTGVPPGGAGDGGTGEEAPHLIGSRCGSCGSSFFPPTAGPCRNPACGAPTLEPVALSRRGTVWSYTVNHYRPPEPYVAAEPFAPYAVAAVELPAERLVVLGQVERGADRLRVGAPAELVVDTLYEDDEHEVVVWKWRIG